MTSTLFNNALNFDGTGGAYLTGRNTAVNMFVREQNHDSLITK